MDKKEQQHLTTGIFVLSGIVLLLAMLFFLGLSDLFTHKVTMQTGFRESVQGLSRGSAVKYRGVQIGTVKDISILVKENIIQPLGMDKTFYDIHEWCTYPISLPHKETADGSLSVIHNITSEGTRFGSGEIFSNVLELCKLERMFLRGGVADNGIRIISEKYLAQMTARQVDRKDGGWHGLGIHHRDYGSHTCYGHTGWLSAYRTNMFVCPDKGCGVVLMLNTNRDKIRDEMLATIFDMV